MNLQELIDFHTVGAEACEAYAVTPGAAEDKNKDIGKHYNKRAKWHRDAIALVQGLSEAALREDLEMFVKAQLGVSISEPGESFVQTTLRLFRMSKRRATEFGIPEGESLEADIQAFEDYDALQQRLAVAEQRAGELEGLLREAATTCRVNDLIISANYFESALKPVEDGSRP